MSSSVFVATGILLSRIIGLVRQRVFAHYFGLESDAADAWSAGFRIPNFLQNLFGEGAMSASFIPVYARLLARGEDAEADRVAGAVGALLALLTTALVAAGVVATPVFIALIAPGFHGEKRDLTIRVVRILFPGIGLLVLSAWCLGILNSHRRFFLSYAAPVLWNVVIIATLLCFGGRRSAESLAIATAWGAVAGSAAQLAVQLPRTFRLAHGMRARIRVRDPEVATVFRNFAPAFVSRGVVQLSAYVDQVLASLLPVGAVAALGYAQTLYTLPVSLFGMAVTAAELPAMSSALGEEDDVARHLRARLGAALRRVAFFIVPSAVAFAALGDVVTAAIYETGRFGSGDVAYVWGILAGSAVGLLASTLGRLYASTWYALRDARRPLRFALVRLAVTTALGIALAFPAPRWLGLEPRWGAAGLTLAAGVAGWVEFALLRRSLAPRIGRVSLAPTFLAALWGSAAVAAAATWALKLALPPLPPLLAAAALLGPYGALYFALAALLGVTESRAVLRRALALRA